MHPRRMKQLLDELGIDDPAADLEFDRSRYELFTLAWMEHEAKCHLMRVGAIVERGAKQ